ncbi:MoaD/ThiS family protein [Pseudomonas sp. HK3]
MIKVLFFGQLREQLKTNELILSNAQSCSVDTIKKTIIASHPHWEEYLSINSLLSSVNQELVQDNHIVEPHSEVAFFPPVTGG